jgi:hypothetical protein
MLITHRTAKEVAQMQAGVAQAHGEAIHYGEFMVEDYWTHMTKQDEIDAAWLDHKSCGCCPCCCTCGEEDDTEEWMQDFPALTNHEAAWEQADLEGLTENHREGISTWECPPYN